VTANAACSIALRNSILKGVPKAFWSDMYEQARQTAVGTVQTLANRRARALAVLQKMGVSSAQVFAFLKIEGEQDITIEHLSTLFGITTALKDGDTTPEQAFAVDGAPPFKPDPKPDAKAALPALPDGEFDAKKAGWQKLVEDGKKTPVELLAMLGTKNTLSEAQRATVSGWTEVKDGAAA
jgi:hypothetical protein